MDKRKVIPSLRSLADQERATAKKARASWQMFTIMAEFIEATEYLSEIRPAVSIYGSADGATWGAKSIAAFKQEFYAGEYPMLLDLAAHPDVKFVRAHWEVARWGRGTETPMFEFGVTLKEVPPEILREATAARK